MVNKELSQITDKHNRKPYSKPVIEKVNLVIDQAVLAGCKMISQYGPGGNNCIKPLTPDPCITTDIS